MNSCTFKNLCIFEKIIGVDAKKCVISLKYGMALRKYNTHRFAYPSKSQMILKGRKK